jgi:HNH endonuclease
MRRIACDATIAIAVDDDVGHTMYEGRARRFPTKAQRREVRRRDRHCRFPDCTNVTFANVHHIVPWEAGGLTDLGNMVLQCLHHHRLVHSNGWSMTGNANEELTIIGPSGRVMTSRPSPLWTRVTDGARIRSGAAGDAGDADAVGDGAGASG